MKKIILITLFSLNAYADSYLVHLTSDNDEVILAKDLPELENILIDAEFNDIKIKEIKPIRIQNEMNIKRIKIGGEGGGDG